MAVIGFDPDTEEVDGVFQGIIVALQDFAGAALCQAQSCVSLGNLRYLPFLHDLR